MAFFSHHHGRVARGHGFLVASHGLLFGHHLPAQSLAVELDRHASEHGAMRQWEDVADFDVVRPAVAVVLANGGFHQHALQLGVHGHSLQTDGHALFVAQTQVHEFVNDGVVLVVMSHCGCPEWFGRRG